MLQIHIIILAGDTTVPLIGSLLEVTHISESSGIGVSKRVP